MQIPKMASYPAAPRITCPSIVPPLLINEPRHNAVPWRVENSDITVDILELLLSICACPDGFFASVCLAHAGAVILEPSAVDE